MHGVPHLRRAQAGSAAAATGVLVRTQPDEALEVEAIRATLQERQRAVRQATDALRPGLRHGRERPQLERGGRLPRRAGLEERQLLELGRRRLGRLRPAIDAEEDLLATRQLELLLVEIRAQPVERPADEATRPVQATRVERAGDDEPVDGTGHGDVVEAASLGLLRRALGLANLVVAEDPDPLAARGIRNPDPEAAVRQAEDLVRLSLDGRAAGVAHDDDRELEALGRVNRHQPHRFGALLLGRRPRPPVRRRAADLGRSGRTPRDRGRGAPRRTGPTARAS